MTKKQIIALTAGVGLLGFALAKVGQHIANNKPCSKGMGISPMTAGKCCKNKGRGFGCGMNGSGFGGNAPFGLDCQTHNRFGGGFGGGFGGNGFGSARPLTVGDILSRDAFDSYDVTKGGFDSGVGSNEGSSEEYSEDTEDPVLQSDIRNQLEQWGKTVKAIFQCDDAPKADYYYALTRSAFADLPNYANAATTNVPTNIDEIRKWLDNFDITQMTPTELGVLAFILQDYIAINVIEADLIAKPISFFTRFYPPLASFALYLYDTLFKLDENDKLVAAFAAEHNRYNYALDYFSRFAAWYCRVISGNIVGITHKQLIDAAKTEIVTLLSIIPEDTTELELAAFRKDIVKYSNLFLKNTYPELIINAEYKAINYNTAITIKGLFADLSDDLALGYKPERIKTTDNIPKEDNSTLDITIRDSIDVETDFNIVEIVEPDNAAAGETESVKIEKPKAVTSVAEKKHSKHNKQNKQKNKKEIGNAVKDNEDTTTMRTLLSTCTYNDTTYSVVQRKRIMPNKIELIDYYVMAGDTITDSSTPLNPINKETGEVIENAYFENYTFAMNFMCDLLGLDAETFQALISTEQTKQ